MILYIILMFASQNGYFENNKDIIGLIRAK